MRRQWILGGALVGICAALFFVRTDKAIFRTSSPENPRELYHLAENQIIAFRRNDFPLAYASAASGIRNRFPLEEFRKMVKNTYPHLTRSGRLSFGEARFANDLRASAIIYVNTEETAVPMIYAFVKEDGKWKIEGVQMLRGDLDGFIGSQPRT